MPLVSFEHRMQYKDNVFPLQVRAELPPSEEDWESEATVTRSYDPRAKAEKMQVG